MIGATVWRWIAIGAVSVVLSVIGLVIWAIWPEIKRNIFL